MNVPGVATNEQYQAKINALKALASIVEVDEPTFRTLLRSRPHPTVVAGNVGFWRFRKSVYLTTYDGFVFALRSPDPLDFAEDAPGAFFVEAKNVTIPFF